MKGHRQGKLTLRSYKVEPAPLPRVDSRLIRDTRKKLRCSRAFLRASCESTKELWRSGNKAVRSQTRRRRRWCCWCASTPILWNVWTGSPACEIMRKLSVEKRRELQALAKRPDSEIDLSDTPEIREIPPDAVIGRFYRPKKSSVTIRLDADVLAWLKASGEGYQTRINDYLRRLMRQKHRR